MAAELIAAPLGVPDYVSIADAETLEELDTVDRPALVEPRRSGFLRRG